MSQPQHVGFWKDTKDSSWYPGKPNYTELPVANSVLHPSQHVQIIAMLQQLEAQLTPIEYLGGSYCRLCDQGNGCGEYTALGFTWPSGYLHYLQDHNVACDPAFAAKLIHAANQ